MGQKCGFIIAGDDVSVGKKGSMVGRRGLAGHVSGEGSIHDSAALEVQEMLTGNSSSPQDDGCSFGR